MLWIDRKYTLLIAAGLRNFKEKRNNLFNASCVFCGDSARDSTRARMYIYEHHGRLTVKCHNCGTSTSLSKLIEAVNPDIYRDYCLERFMEKTKSVAEAAIQTANNVVAVIQEKHEFLTPISDLLPTHPASQYLRSRLLPEQFYNELYYTSDFKALCDKDWPDHGRELVSDGRIVWYLTNMDEYVTHICGRALWNVETRLRYIKLRVQGNDGDAKVFGLTRTDLSQRVYVLEGELDSLFLPNAVASGDSNLERLAEELEHKFDCETTIIFDNEPRNKDIVKQMDRVVNGGHSIVIWPDNMSGKDINEMVINGIKPELIMEVIKDNTFQGPLAALEFGKWKKW